jgi:glycosyltransferase involved in cell wall biosynthesis
MQDHENFELIIANDGSIDGTKAYLEELEKSDSRVRAIHIPEAMGPSHARNVAIKEANGEFITDLDDDDEILPGRISVFLRHWDKEYAFITSGLFWDYGKSRKLLGGKNIDVTLEDLLSHKHQPIHFFTRKEYYVNAGLFDETMRNSEDWDMGIRLGLLQQPMKQIADATYIIHTAHDSPRLSHDTRKAAGMRRLIEKYQDLMSEKNKKDMAVRLAIAEGRSLPLSELMNLLTEDTFRVYAKFILNSRLPAATAFLRKIAKRGK